MAPLFPFLCLCALHVVSVPVVRFVRSDGAGWRRGTERWVEPEGSGRAGFCSERVFVHGDRSPQWPADVRGWQPPLRGVQFSSCPQRPLEPRQRVDAMDNSVHVHRCTRGVSAAAPRATGQDTNPTNCRRNHPRENKNRLYTSAHITLPRMKKDTCPTRRQSYPSWKTQAKKKRAPVRTSQGTAPSVFRHYPSCCRPYEVNDTA